jgi:thioredoxin reductase
MRGFFLLRALRVTQSWEVIIVGGGPAGLSAALTLGRCRRRVLVCDGGRTRNRFAAHMHAFLSRDGIAPAEFLRISREQLGRYESVVLVQGEATEILGTDSRFQVVLADGSRHFARKLLLATGVVDHIPPLPGIDRFYGVSVHHCPYCDGWECRDRPIAVYGHRDKQGAGLALMLRQWSRDVVLLTNGPAELSREVSERLRAHSIAVKEDRITLLDGTADGQLERIVFEDGSTIARRALFFNTGQHQRSALAARLGCEFTERGGVSAGEHEVTTSVPGVFVAGDASRDVQLVIVAAAEGTKAAFVINRQLLVEDGMTAD